MNSFPNVQLRNASPSPSMGSHMSRLTANEMSTKEDPYAFLSYFDTIFLIDDSSSMYSRTSSGTRWDEAKKVLREIAPICTAHDKDGIDVYFLNHKTYEQSDDPGRAETGYYNIDSAQRVDQIMSTVQPGGTTPTSIRLEKILAKYIRNYEEELAAVNGDYTALDHIKPVNIIVITDGRPDSEPDGVIVRMAKKLDNVDAPKHQVGIQFFQVGNDLAATEALQELDDGLAKKWKCRDMVDTVSWNSRKGGAKALTADAVLKVVLGAVTKRLDNTSVASSSRLQPPRF